MYISLEHLQIRNKQKFFKWKKKKSKQTWTKIEQNRKLED